MTQRIDRRNDRRGFTLVELMVVIVILGIIGTMAFVFVLDKPDKAKWTKAQTEMGEIQKALNTYALEHDSEYPDSLEVLTETYFKSGLPKDPFTKDDYIYEVLDDGFTLTCLGKDQAEGGAEVPDKDIVYTESGLMEESN
ncbi:MAG: prepilin-type N-terminal cleavage/methylation domain-containing protein [Planctomycetes bacterium]|nr:prepilin-type N-terminal cleavage/methylation domain-containing protein [Planctomycetota bacterium]MCA8937859.1 prepilin-type N-terminal cleavage/methylation domain-containing protein [Planctomycetota bacterium]